MGKVVFVLIAVQIKGGLGNQMWQYAYGRYLSLRYGTELKLDLSWFRVNHVPFALGNFNIHATVMEAGTYNLNLIRENWDVPSRLMVLGDNIYLSGYWQNIMYFEPIEDFIRADFRLKSALSPHSIECLHAIHESNMPVSVHVRRGDYLSITYGENKRLYAICTPQYYETCVDLLQQRLSDIELFIFSNDMKWCKEHLHFNVPTYYCEGNDKEHGYEDIFLMSQCRHHVIANSSFSWWGAWLNDRKEKWVLAPERYVMRDDGLFGVFNKDWLPQDWCVVRGGGMPIGHGL